MDRMNAVQNRMEGNTLDVRGLGHGEREGLVFPAIEGLKGGDTLRIVAEFNPVPLVYMLRAREGFSVSYVKEGPDEWILEVKRTAPADPARKTLLKRLLAEMKDGTVSGEAKERAKELLKDVDAATLGMLEQELIREGVSHEEIRRGLCDIHLEAMRDTLVSKRREVEAPHPVHTFMEEHRVILESLRELGSIATRLETAGSFKEIEKDLEALKEVSHHLVEAESHHQREEEALFPKLRKHDVTEPPAIMEEEHIEFRKRKQELYRMAQNPQDYSFGEFKEKVMALGRYLARELESHIFKEDNILYQIALEVLTDGEWAEVKRECDKIGYCCFTPADRKKDKEKEATEE